MYLTLFFLLLIELDYLFAYNAFEPNDSNTIGKGARMFAIYCFMLHISIEKKKNPTHTLISIANPFIEKFCGQKLSPKVVAESITL